MDSITLFGVQDSSIWVSIPIAQYGPNVPPWDFAPWLYVVSKLLAHGCPSQMLHLGQMSSPGLLEPERKSLTSEMSPQWDIAPWLYLVSKLLANGCLSQMLTQGQVLRSYILKPLRKDLTSIMSFILSLLVFGGQNVYECVQSLIPNLCMTFKRWQDYEWRPETQFWRSEARQPPNMFLMDLHPRCSVHAKFGVIPSMGGHFRASVTYKKRLCCPPFFVFNPILAGWLPL